MRIICVNVFFLFRESYESADEEKERQVTNHHCVFSDTALQTLVNSDTKHKNIRTFPVLRFERIEIQHSYHSFFFFIHFKSNVIFYLVCTFFFVDLCLCLCF